MTHSKKADAFIRDYIDMCKKHGLALRYDSGQVADSVGELGVPEVFEATQFRVHLLLDGIEQRIWARRAGNMPNATVTGRRRRKRR